MTTNNNLNNAYAGRGISAITDTTSTNQSSYNPTGLAAANAVKWNGTASIGIAGMQTGAEGRHVTIVNASSDYLLWIEHENNLSASASERFNLPQGYPAFLMPGDNITFLYRDSRWGVYHWPNQGAAMGLTFFTDGLEGGTILGSTVSGTGASTQVSTYLVNTTEKPMGVQQIDTGTTAAGISKLAATGSGGIPPLFAGLSVARFANEALPTTAQNYNLQTGFFNTSTVTPSGVYWNLTNDAVDGQRWFRRVHISGSLSSNTFSNSVAPGLLYSWYVLFINQAWTRADFIWSDSSIDFSVRYTHTGSMPPSTDLVDWCALALSKTAGNTQVNATFDFAGYRLSMVRG